MCFGGGGNKGSQAQAAANNAAADANLKMAQQQRQDEIDRQNRVNQGIGTINKTFSRFNDAFYNGKSKNYLDYYKPQVDQQYGEAKQSTLFQLARQGINDSSAGAKVYGDLARDYGNQNQSIQSGANAYAQQARSQVEAQRNSLINQVNATANPQAAASAANNAVGSLQMVEPAGGYSPLAGLFSTFTGALGSGAAGYQYQNPGVLGGLGKSNSGGNSARVVKTG